jgi:competence ComEA-like helix-hairpin-helix protein
MSEAPGAPDDWTTGPAKWAAVAVLGAASILGMTWSILGRSPRRPAEPAAPPAASVAEAAPAPPITAPAAPNSLVAININTATAAELELLPGIGPALAARIVEDRERKGLFKSVDNLDRVKGIGPETLRKLRSAATAD